MRVDGRAQADMRPVKITRHYTMHAEGSVLVEFGNTKVLCTASVENKVPRFLKGEGKGWITAEYSLLPRATATRTNREATKGRQTGRTVEIQRLIGRALRAVVDMEAIGERTITLDCDVLQADGGTRTAAITGAFVALVDAVDSIYGGVGKFPVEDFCAAVSVGIGDQGPITDLCYAEDSEAVVDMNVVRTGRGNLIEVQGTGEHGTFTRSELDTLMDMAEQATEVLFKAQKEALGMTADKIGAVCNKVVLATHNQGKIREFKAALSELGLEAVSIGELCQVNEPEETGKTFMENALLKARYYMEFCRLPCLADDSGLAVEPLHGAPGVYSARYAGENATDEENNEKLLRELADVPFEKSKAKYICALALVYPDGRYLTAKGACEGLIKKEANGEGGFGYDPYFYVPELGTTMADISLEEKNKRSHRALALRLLVDKLRAEDATHE